VRVIETKFYFGLFFRTELQETEVCVVLVDIHSTDQLQQKFPDALKLIVANAGRAIDQQENIAWLLRAA
jgi:hypothetical protein